MSQKTENQVAEMKKQTIGVEVEMNSITRSAAAKLAADFFGTGRYEDTARRNGYCTWSAWDESGREWKFQKDVSIAGPDSEKCEMVTPILTYADMETLQELIRRLRRAGAKSDATRGCGVHIHIGAKGHTPQTLRNLANIMASHEDLLASALNLDRGRISRYCRTVDPRFLERLNRRKPTTMAELADIWYGSQNADYGRSQHYNDSRYHMLNIHATFTKGTVEFRLFQFDAPADGKQNGLHAGQLKSSHYDADAADYAVMFIESLCHTKGTWARQPFERIDWQEQIIRDIFGVLKPNGYRQFNTAYIEIPKKQGKSELAAAVTERNVPRCTAAPPTANRLPSFSMWRRIWCGCVRHFPSGSRYWIPRNGSFISRRTVSTRCSLPMSATSTVSTPTVWCSTNCTRSPTASSLMS